MEQDEKKTITGNEPAFPCQASLHGVQHTGFSKREEYAKAAMQSLLAKGVPPSKIPREAFQMADRMIDQSNKPAE